MSHHIKNISCTEIFSSRMGADEANQKHYLVLGGQEDFSTACMWLPLETTLADEGSSTLFAYVCVSGRAVEQPGLMKT